SVQDPLAVRRELLRGALAEADSGRAVGLTHVRSAVRAGGVSRLVHQNDPAVVGQTRECRAIEPGELPLARGSRSERPHAGRARVALDENPAIPGDVVNDQAYRETGENARASGAVDRLEEELAVFAEIVEPDLFAGGRPGEPLAPHSIRHEGGPVSLQIDRHERVASPAALEDREDIALRREARE